MKINNYKEEKSFDGTDIKFCHQKGRPSLKSTVNTNYAVQNNVQYNNKQSNKDIKEITQKSIEILSEFIFKEEKIKEKNATINENVDELKI